MEEIMDSQNMNGNYEVVKDASKPDVLSIVGLILGILAILFGCCCCTWLGLILGIVGIVLSILGNKKNPTTLGKVALIVSIVGVVFSVGNMILGMFVSTTGWLTEFINSVN